MGYSKMALESKLFEIYPELHRKDVSMSLRFDEETKAWMVGLKKGHHMLETYLDKADADSCVEGHVCVPLGVKIGEFLDNFAH